MSEKQENAHCRYETLRRVREVYEDEKKMMGNKRKAKWTERGKF